MIPDRFAWLFWASAFLVPWLVLFAAFPRHRRAMVWASLFTTPFGLTEPVFVPRYWNPPSLFDLAQRTGFDIESLIFCFGIGGVGAVLYNVLTRQVAEAVSAEEKRRPLHRFHPWALAAPFIVFPILYFLPWNPIYAGIFAMLVGAIATLWCRPDLRAKSWVGGVLFLVYYTIFLQGLRWTSPGYVERVWNLKALSGIVLLGMPLEELLFATFFGMYWACVYEHVNWMRPVAARPARDREPAGDRIEAGRQSATGRGGGRPADTTRGRTFRSSTPARGARRGKTREVRVNA